MIDDTVTQRESNGIFRILDTDKSGKVSLAEFERYFSVDPTTMNLTSSVEKLRWAIDIFHEINHKMQEKKYARVT
jgi:Ca2+-binding EF-hand superfamily protein